jgi:hypothetical protein
MEEFGDEATQQVLRFGPRSKFETHPLKHTSTS